MPYKLIQVMCAIDIIHFPSLSGKSTAAVNDPMLLKKEGWGQYSAHLRVSFSAKRRWKIYITPFCFTNKFSSLIQLSSKIKYMDRIFYNH